MTGQVLVINPGSTSTKIGLYDKGQQQWVETIEHSMADLHVYNSIHEQFDMRYQLVVDTAKAKGVIQQNLAAVVSRGGPFARIHSGAYEITDAMLQKMWIDPVDNHASNLGMAIAHKLASALGIKGYIYDAVTVDELIPLVRITGLKEMSRYGQGHNLNMRAAALQLCQTNDWDYNSKNIIVAHLGGGITLSLHSQGKIIDMISDDEGPFSPERAGGLPGFQLINLCYGGKVDKKNMMKHIQRAGGLASHFGTTDARSIEKMIANGDEHARLVYEAMALNVAKNIAKLSVVVHGKVHAIVITGGIAHSQMQTTWITERVSFIAPVSIIAGENEMRALALGVARVLEGKETARVYSEE